LPEFNSPTESNPKKSPPENPSSTTIDNISLETVGRDINEPYDSIGSTLLISAAHGSVEIVQLLVEAGADVNARAWGTDESALDIAVRDQNTEIMHYLWPLCSDETREHAGLPVDPRQNV
jgi:ankyrin repeat protein